MRLVGAGSLPDTLRNCRRQEICGNAEGCQELPYLVFQILSEHLLLNSLRIAVLYRVREIVQVGASLTNEFEACGLSVPWMDRRHPIFGKSFEFVQSREPAFKVSFLQIKVRLIVDQVRGEKRF